MIVACCATTASSETTPLSFCGGHGFRRKSSLDSDTSQEIELLEVIQTKITHPAGVQKLILCDSTVKE